MCWFRRPMHTHPDADAMTRESYIDAPCRCGRMWVPRPTQSAYLREVPTHDIASIASAIKVRVTHRNRLQDRLASAPPKMVKLESATACSARKPQPRMYNGTKTPPPPMPPPAQTCAVSFVRVVRSLCDFECDGCRGAKCCGMPKAVQDARRPKAARARQLRLRNSLVRTCCNEEGGDSNEPADDISSVQWPKMLMARLFWVCVVWCWGRAWVVPRLHVFVVVVCGSLMSACAHNGPRC